MIGESQKRPEAMTESEALAEYQRIRSKPGALSSADMWRMNDCQRRYIELRDPAKAVASA